MDCYACRQCRQQEAKLKELDQTCDRLTALVFDLAKNIAQQTHRREGWRGVAQFFDTPQDWPADEQLLNTAYDRWLAENPEGDR